MFDPNPLDNVPEQIRSMYDKAFRAARDGAMDAFKDLPKHMQSALDSEGIKDMIGGWDAISDNVRHASRELDIEAKKINSLIDLVSRLNDEFREQADIELDILNEERDRVTTLQEFVKKQETAERHIERTNKRLLAGNDLLQNMTDSYTNITEASSRLNKLQTQFGKGQAASVVAAAMLGKKWSQIGGNIAAINGLFNRGAWRSILGGGGASGGGGGWFGRLFGMGGGGGRGGGGGVGAPFIAGLAAMGRGLGLLIGKIDEAYQISRNMGYSVGQSISNVGTGIVDWISALQAGTLTSVKTQVELRNLFSREIGSRNAPDEVMKGAADLVAYYRLSAQEAAKLSMAVYRNGRFNATQQVKDLNILRNTAKVNGLEPGEILRVAAQEGNIFATYAERGSAAFARSVVEVRKLGLTLRSVSGFADRMVNDFESALMMQAKIQSIMPGVDFSEVQYASQFGTDGDVAAALRSAFGGTNMMALPRSLRNLISQQTGLGMEELRNIDRGVAPGTESTKTGGDVDERSKMEKFIGSVDRSITAVNAFTLALVLATARMGMSMIGRSTGAMMSRGGAMAAGAGIIGGGLALGYSAYDVGSSVMNAPTGKRGEAALSGLNRNKFTALGATAGGIAGGLGGFGFGAIPGTMIGALAGGVIDQIVNYFSKSSSEVHHRGGIVGSASVTRMTPTAVFSSAPKLHTGLLPDEVPAILQSGEAVLSRTQLSGLMGMIASMRALVAGVASLSPTNTTMMKNVSSVNNLLQAPATLGNTTMSSLASFGTISSRNMEPTTNTSMERMATLPTVSSTGTIDRGPTASVSTVSPVSMEDMRVFNTVSKTYTDSGLASAVGMRSSPQQAPQPPVNMAAIEGLLAQLLSVTKEGKNIYLDGKKVGNTIASAFSREL